MWQGESSDSETEPARVDLCPQISHDCAELAQSWQAGEDQAGPVSPAAASRLDPRCPELAAGWGAGRSCFPRALQEWAQGWSSVGWKVGRKELSPLVVSWA